MIDILNLPHDRHHVRLLQQAHADQIEAGYRRMQDAFGMGCQRVFTVTDFNFSSPANLQRCGLALAYNYRLLRRDPVPL